MLDNRIRTLASFKHQGHSKKLLVLDYKYHYRLPTTKSLTGQLLQRLCLQHPYLDSLIFESQFEWTTPFSQEQILGFNPDCLILSTSFDPLNAPPSIPCLQTHHLYCVDANIQDSPTQFIILAYLDLFQAISMMYLT